MTLWTDPVRRGGGGTVQRESRFHESKVRRGDPPAHYKVRLLSVYSRLPEDCL